MTTAHGDERAKVIDARVLAAIAPSMTPRERVQALAELRALLVGNRHRRTTTTTTRGVKRTPWKPSGKSARERARGGEARGGDGRGRARGGGGDVAAAERRVLASSWCVKLVRDILEQLSPLCARASVGTKYKQLRSDWKRCEIEWTRAQRKRREPRRREFGRVARRLAR